MKVLFLARKREGIGGVEKHVGEVAKCLIKKGHKITVVAENDMGLLVARENRLKKFKIWWWLWQNRSLINESDIIHAHDVAFWYFPFCFLYLRKPFFVTFHGWEGKFPVPWKNKLIRKISEKMARGNICVGNFIEKWYGTKADYITYGGVN